MNKIVFALSVIAFFLFNSNCIAQEKEEKDIKEKVERPILGDPTKNEVTKRDVTKFKPLMEPNAVHVSGSVLSFFKDKSVCDKIYKATAKVKVKKVVRSGSALVNSISSGQDITLIFLRKNSKTLDMFERKAIKDKMISFILRETLCSDPDTKETIYEVVRFKVK
ncbi:hypothetical protein U6A24_16720 [Aquimarina gracilis]|uniref:Uncharacterized protein n=1 Tax=Aquimarina gracilis TaxID=874422 RepID=A0ABU5ZZ01_9FLAO|nr:hypothetical protein [Aquimarina gracilis]MEB3347119.1 hypothetical protein [Aquimarina gracilis]